LLLIFLQLIYSSLAELIFTGSYHSSFMLPDCLAQLLKLDNAALLLRKQLTNWVLTR